MAKCWCGKCGRGGIIGLNGQDCPQCIQRNDQPYGKLYENVKDYEADHAKEAEAIKLARKDNVLKGQKGTEEMIADAKADMMKTLASEIANVRAEAKAEVAKEKAELVKERRILNLEKARLAKAQGSGVTTKS